MSANANKQILLAAPQGRSNLSVWSAFFMGTRLTLWALILGCFTTGCAAPLLAFSSSTTAAASSAGTAATSIAIANPTTAASLLSTATTGKSPLEHAASAATKQDCNFLNALGPKPICMDIPIPQVTDLSEPYPGLADAISVPGAKGQ